MSQIGTVLNELVVHQAGEQKSDDITRFQTGYLAPHLHELMLNQ